MTPGSGYSNSALWDGGTFNDTLNGVTISQISHTPDTVTLNVSYTAAPCTPSNPTVSISPINQQGVAGASLNYNVNITNRNNASCSASTYTISPILTSGFNSSAKSITLSSGASGNVTISISSVTGLADGSYPFSINISDSNNAGFGSTLNGSYIVYTPVPDTEIPTVSITSPTNNSTISGTQVTVSVSATDNISVSKVELLIDNKLVTTLNIKPYNYKWNIRKLNSGQHTITAKTYDSSGNTNSSTITVIK